MPDRTSTITDPEARIAELEATVAGLRRELARRRRGDDELELAQAWMDLAQEAGAVGAYRLDLAEGELSWSDSTYTLYALDPGEPPSVERWLETIVPDDREAARAVALAAIERGEPIHHEFRILRPDGSIRWIADRGRVTVDGSGRPQRLFGLNIDVTELKLAHQELADRKDQLRFTFENAAVGIAHVAPDGTFQRVNRFLCEFLGYPEEELLRARFQDITHPDDLNADIALVTRLAAGETDSYSMEKRYIRKSGEVVWADLNVAARRAPDGRTLNYISAISDIRDRKAAEEKVRFILGELSHRSKNLFAVVQAMVRQTRATAQDVDQFARALDERLVGLAASQDLLLENEVRGAPLDNLVRRQLGAFVGNLGERVTCSGPDIWLNSQSAQTLGMALHELATNATKYGSLSNPEGRVDIRWSVTDSPTGDRLILEWVESLGPPPAGSPRRGFGTRVIEQLVAGTLMADVRLDMPPSGLIWRLDAPLANLAPEAAA